MTKIFISYRRDDSQYVTDSIYFQMSQLFGKENVFLDVGSIPAGVDFRQYLNDQMAEHDVVLVIIGTEWARVMEERAHQTDDFVRIEIEYALKQKKLVIPILVKNARMPDFSRLPESIQDLQWRNSATIRRQPDLENDCAKLANSIIIQLPQNSTDLMPDPFAWITIPYKGYDIAKYPITNAQFVKFIEADGYRTKEWWTAIGWRQRQKNNWVEPRFWNDIKWNTDTQPVVGISWYEAVAFCLWLSTMTDEDIMLPTEDQWRYAAQGDDKRIYPWGNEWNPLLCRNSVGKYGIASNTSSVLMFEGKGADSPFGVVDMVGNVWEWCLTDYESNNNSLGTSSSKKVFCGGSWYDSDPDDFRCTSRSRYNPHEWFDSIGFRLCRKSD